MQTTDSTNLTRPAKGTAFTPGGPSAGEGAGRWKVISVRRESARGGRPGRGGSGVRVFATPADAYDGGSRRALANWSLEEWHETARDVEDPTDG